MDSIQNYSKERQKRARKDRRTGIIILTCVLLALMAPVAIGLTSRHLEQQKFEQETAARNAQAQILSQQRVCLNNAHSAYMEKWNANDTNGDGKLSYDEGYFEADTNYYDSQIACYREYKTDDSADYISDLQTKRQQKVDEKTALEKTMSDVLNNATKYTPPVYNQPTHCTSNMIGSSVYTNCY